MKWFRSNIKSGARLALLALFFQIALSFGHFHALAAPSPGLSATGSAVAPNASATVIDDASTQKQTSRPAPAKHGGDEHGPDGCAICAVVAMAGAVVFSAPPILHLPEAVELLFRTTDAELIHLQAPGAAFQPRAPPLS